MGLCHFSKIKAFFFMCHQLTQSKKSLTLNIWSSYRTNSTFVVIKIKKSNISPRETMVMEKALAVCVHHSRRGFSSL